MNCSCWHVTVQTSWLEGSQSSDIYRGYTTLCVTTPIAQVARLAAVAAESCALRSEMRMVQSVTKDNIVQKEAAKEHLWQIVVKSVNWQ